MKKLIMIAAILFSTGQLFAQTALGEVLGEVHDGEEKGIPGLHVFIIDNDAKYQAKTDSDGRFRISAIPAGTYELFIRDVIKKDTMSAITVNVPMDGFDNLGIVPFVSSIQDQDAIVIKYERDGLRMVDGNLPIKTLTSEEIKNSPVKFDIKKLVTSMSSDVRQTEDGSLVFRGARKGDMIYIMDGVKMRDAGSVPSVSIGRMQLYTGGLPAKYGDTLGGVVVMESKGYFDLYRAWKAAELKAGND